MNVMTEQMLVLVWRISFSKQEATQRGDFVYGEFIVHLYLWIFYELRWKSPFTQILV
jgi:hypothetical protein